ncbi:uncharacterized protein ARMOST_09068 [Armillaria ostoyae]|uniref:Uncharacterized protein n=1 Tax=Armillaria ostoyae TaxID=47428 RepID=A0A284RAH1_ARMOS|nr:uncharacterized protein ARMOST_09068 [Armillaria ostoyae]
MVSQHTPKSEEECRAAHNASSCQSYQKHRLDINKRRRDTYQAVAKKAKKKSKGCLKPLVRWAARNIDIEVNAGETHTQRSSELAATLDQLERLGWRFSLLTENSPRRFAESIYHEYLGTINSRRPHGFWSLINNTITRLSTLENSAREYEHVVLNLAGVGKEMAYVQTILAPIGQLIYWLEDILCKAMIGLNSLQVKYDNQELAFCSDNI